MKTNQVSDVVESLSASTSSKLLEKLPASKRPLDKVAPGIKDYLANVEINKHLPDYIQQIFKAYDVKITMAGYAPSPMEPISTNSAPSAVPASGKK